jgi:hypothetical protein
MPFKLFGKKMHINGMKFLLCHFFGQMLDRNNPIIIRA